MESPEGTGRRVPGVGGRRERGWRVPAAPGSSRGAGSQAGGRGMPDRGGPERWAVMGDPVGQRVQLLWSRCTELCRPSFPGKTDVRALSQRGVGGDKRLTPQCPPLFLSHSPQISLRPPQLQTHCPDRRADPLPPVPSTCAGDKTSGLGGPGERRVLGGHTGVDPSTRARSQALVGGGFGRGPRGFVRQQGAFRAGSSSRCFSGVVPRLKESDVCGSVPGGLLLPAPRPGTGLAELPRDARGSGRVTGKARAVPAVGIRTISRQGITRLGQLPAGCSGAGLQCPPKSPQTPPCLKAEPSLPRGSAPQDSTC